MRSIVRSIDKSLIRDSLEGYRGNILLAVNCPSTERDVDY